MAKQGLLVMDAALPISSDLPIHQQVTQAPLNSTHHARLAPPRTSGGIERLDRQGRHRRLGRHGTWPVLLLAAFALISPVP
jgi:hypothetical protein